MNTKVKIFFIYNSFNMEDIILLGGQYLHPTLYLLSLFYLSLHLVKLLLAYTPLPPLPFPPANHHLNILFTAASSSHSGDIHSFKLENC